MADKIKVSNFEFFGKNIVFQSILRRAVVICKMCTSQPFITFIVPVQLPQRSLSVKMTQRSLSIKMTQC